MRRPGRTTWPAKRPLIDGGEHEEPQFVTSPCLNALDKRWEDMEKQLNLASEEVKQVVRGLKPCGSGLGPREPTKRPHGDCEDGMDMGRHRIEPTALLPNGTERLLQNLGL